MHYSALFFVNFMHCSASNTIKMYPLRRIQNGKNVILCRICMIHVLKAIKLRHSVPICLKYRGNVTLITKIILKMSELYAF